MTWVIDIDTTGASQLQRARAVAACWAVFEREAVHPRLAERAAYAESEEAPSASAEKAELTAVWHEAVEAAVAACWAGVHPRPPTAIVVREIDDEAMRQPGDEKGLGSD
ncbi:MULTISPECIES: hypothetical protein [unclassified Methylibium]|uniref:hypothetical protein n=1 Tax=unclassified Methylibium TaxID=2633235 RepID=UPI0003F3F195|nr:MULTISPECIES: hypothetical protein [unclassified Methylibium]EWS54895.1 hypothetical protein X551_02290 [Methylibium sp. T29]EWS61751.1 hypothetical protein Y694_00537 [Methylibium sp. T29-B]